MNLFAAFVLFALIQCGVSLSFRRDTINYKDVLDARENVDEKCGADLDDSLRDAFKDWMRDTRPLPGTTADDPAFRTFLAQESDWTHSLCECQNGQARYDSVVANFKAVYPDANTDSLIVSVPPTLPELPTAEECRQAKIRHDEEDDEDEDEEDEDEHHHHHCRDANGVRTACPDPASTSASSTEASPEPTGDSVQLGDSSPGIRNVVNSGAVSDMGARAFGMGVLLPLAMGVLFV